MARPGRIVTWPEGRLRCQYSPIDAVPGAGPDQSPRYVGRPWRGNLNAEGMGEGSGSGGGGKKRLP